VQSAVYRTTLAAVLLCPGVSLVLLGAGVDGLTLRLPLAMAPTTPAADSVDVGVAEHGQASEVAPDLAAAHAVAELPVEARPADAPRTTEPPGSARRHFPPGRAAPAAEQAARSAFNVETSAIPALALTATWLVVSSVMLVRLAASCAATRSLRTSAREADPETASQCRALAARMGVRAPPVLRSPLVTSPCLVGLCRPAILLPDTQDGGGTAGSPILVHELAHLARNDCLWNLLSRLGLAILFFQPLLWALRRRMVRTAEEVCDDYVIDFGFDSRDYACCLAELAERFRAPSPAAAVAMASLRSWLARRVVRILDTARPLSTRARLRALVAIALVGIVATTFVGMVGVGGPRAQGADKARPTDADQAEEPASAAEKQDAGKAEAGDEEQPDENADMLSTLGKVVDAQRKPIAGATVYLREWAYYRYSEDPYNESPQDVLAQVQTGDDGTFRFEDVAAPPFQRSWSVETPWDIVVVADGYGMAWRHLRKARDETPMTLTMPPEARLTGRLVDAQGRPIAGAQFEVHELAGLASEIRELPARSADRLLVGMSQLAPKVKSDADGRFTIDGLPPGVRVACTAKHEDYARRVIYAATTDEPQPDLEGVTYHRGERRETKHQVHTGDFTLQLEPGFHVLGRALFADTRRPCARAKVMLYWQNRSHQAYADAEGRFAFHGVSDPDWYVHVSPPERGVYLHRQIRLPSLSEDNRTANVEVELPRGQAITGSVVDEATGEGVPGVAVSFTQDVPEDAPDRTYAAAATTDESGRFRVIAPLGKGYVIISGSVPGYDLLRYLRPDEEPDPRYARSVEVKPGEPVRDVQFTLGRGLVVNGRVTDPEGKPLAGAEVKTRFRPQARIEETSTQTDDEGRFTLAGFPPTSGLDLDVKHRGRKLIGDASVEADEQAGASRAVNVDVQLQQAATVKGRVLADGEPMPGFRVELLQLRTYDGVTHGMPVDHATTDDAGQFQFDTAPPGEGTHVYSFSDEVTQLSSATFDLKPGQTYELGTFELRTKSMSVSGIVVDPEGNPVEGAQVSARERNGPSIDGAFTRQPTGKDGRFAIRGVPDVPLSIMAHVPYAPGSKERETQVGGVVKALSSDRRIHFAAAVDAMPGETNVRIVLDPKLQRGRPERIQPVEPE